MLPITDYLPRISELLSAGNNLVLQAEPGAGKSTALPLSLLDAQWLKGKKILMLEPRRLAAKSIAHYLASQLGEKVGKRIGYQIKNERKLSNETVLEIVTEGILTRRLQRDSELADFALIIFDEFHERSIHADLSLMLALEIQQTIREDLKLLVMSATIDTRLVSRYMNGAEIIECPGRVFPVSVDYRKAGREPLLSQVVSTLRRALGPDTSGDTLVFLPGRADINRCVSESKRVFAADSNLMFLPLYGGLSLFQQEQALVADPSGKRRVVFTTNIAETSLTIEGVSCVIDSGLEKVLVYDPASSMTRLEIRTISKASAEQRKGRAGRIREGACIRLWDEHKHKTLRDYQGEEILSADLCGYVLELFVWGAGEYGDINWLTAPPLAHFSAAKETLQTLGLIDANNKVTSLGESVAGVGLAPSLATMLFRAEGAIEKGIACELAALLSDRDIFYPNNGIDIVARLLALQDYKSNRNRALKNHPLVKNAAEQLLLSCAALRRNVSLVKSEIVYSLLQLQDSVGKLLLYAYPFRLAKRRSNTCGRYQLANGRGVYLFEDDALFGSEWLIVADADAQKKEGRIYSATSILYESVRDSLSDKFNETDQFEFNRERQKISGRNVVSYGAITVKTTIIADVPKDRFQECLQQIFQQSGLEILNWTTNCEIWLSRAQWLAKHLNGFPALSKSFLLENLEEWLLPYIATVNSIAALKKVNVLELLVGSLSWSDQQLLNLEAPTQYITPSNKTVPIIYDSQQGPTVSVQLQEMFGQIESPKIGGGNVALRFELLSPARRPIQTTSDLANFWKTSYFDVAKEMKGRYPKHRWPDQPLLEKAGKSIKRK